MNGTVNVVMLVGHLGQDATVRTMPSGTAVTNFSVATTAMWREKGTDAKKEKTEWTRVTFFGQGAEAVSPYLKKGTLVYVQGRLETRKWKDRQGLDRSTTEVRADKVTLLTRGKSRPPVDEHDQRRDEDVDVARDPLGPVDSPVDDGSDIPF